jgi:asparagine synthetase B (glutamine-hydrolysing)
MQDTSRQRSGDIQLTNVKLLVSNPAARHVETAAGDWIVSGFDPTAVTASLDDTTSLDDVVERIRSLPGEYSVVFVDTRTPRVEAFRSITSAFDVFYCERPTDGAMVVGDHFRDVLAELPVANRTVASSVPVEQLLLGGVPNASYVEEIGRLGHGERLDWTADAPPETTLVDRLSVDERIERSTAKRRLDRQLRAALGGDRFGEPVVTMLSGGVDSTLLHTYLDTEATVSAAFDSPEFEFEVDYARAASELLGSTHELLSFEERAYREYLESAIDAVGHPLLLPQTAMMHLVFRESDYQTYVNGLLADGLLGVGDAALAYLAQYLGPTAQLLPEFSGEAVALKRTAEQIGRPATALDGSAMNFRIHANQADVASIFGQDAVDAAKQKRLRYTAARIDVDTDAGYDAHMHLGHAIEYFHDVLTENWRHAAHASGRSLSLPFCDRALLETVLALPPADRYARFAVPPLDNPTHIVQAKYLSKDLLADRLPHYNTKQRKGHSLLPAQRFLESGPLSTIFETYPVPAFIPEEYHEFVRNGTEELSWYAANYAIWQRRVLENDDLTTFETTRVFEFGAPTVR